MSGFNIKIQRSKRRLVDRRQFSDWGFYQLELLWKDCVKAFITAAIEAVHVDTGMSEASFYDLATNVRLGAAVLAHISGRGPNPPRPAYVDIDGSVHEGTKKSITLGKSLGEKAYKLRFGSRVSPRLVFEFNIVIFQYKLREFGFDGDPAWDSLAKGKFAFLEAWTENFHKRLGTRDFLEFLKPQGVITSS